MDTKKIVAELLSTDLSQQQLADLVPCSQSAIAAFLSGQRGKRPSMVIGMRLAELHRLRCKVSSQIPTPKQNRAADTPEVIREVEPGTRRVNHVIDRGSA